MGLITGAISLPILRPIMETRGRSPGTLNMCSWVLVGNSPERGVMTRRGTIRVSHRIRVDLIRFTRSQISGLTYQSFPSPQVCGFFASEPEYWDCCGDGSGKVCLIPLHCSERGRVCRICSPLRTEDP